MKILILPGSYYSYKTESLDGYFFKEQALALARAGIDLKVLYVNFKKLRVTKYLRLKDMFFYKTLDVEDGLETLRINGLNVISRRFPIGHGLWIFASLLLFEDYIRKFGKPDLIHAHVYWAGDIARKIKKKYGIPYVLTEHSTQFPSRSIPLWHQKALTPIFDQADALIAVGQTLKDRMQEFTEKEVRVIPNCIDVKFFKPKGPKPNDVFYFACVALLNPRKNISLPIKALAQIAEEYPNAKMKIYGEGPDWKILQTLVSELQLTERVEFFGNVSRKEICEAFNSFHALIISSEIETFGVVAIEANAMGIPVISTRCGGPESIITPLTGILVEKGDISAMCGAMKKMMDQYESYDPKDIRNYAIEHFSNEAVADRIIHVYNEVLEMKAVS